MGCDSDPKPAATATLTNNAAIKTQMDELEAIVADLEEDSENFGGSNWREVVPSVKEHVEQLRGAVDDLLKALKYPE
jgi:tetrahydromethanopterin S-methyltransferase subunit B